MKFDLKEDQIMSEIENLDLQIRNLEEIIIKDEKELDKIIDSLIEQEERLENDLKKAEIDLKHAVTSHYNKQIIEDSIQKILDYTKVEFRHKYNSDVLPFKKDKNGKFQQIDINLSILMEESLTDIVKNSSWKHDSKKLIFLEYLKILYFILGGVSILIFIGNQKLDGFFLYLSFFISFLVFSYALFSIQRIRFYGKGSRDKFYETFFKKTIESVYNEQIVFLDSIIGLEKELIKLI